MKIVGSGREKESAEAWIMDECAIIKCYINTRIGQIRKQKMPCKFGMQYFHI